jgi:tRNA dimethylallyltransferase
MGTKTCVYILGPTAIGKSDVAIELALAFNTEIVSADSRQIYRELSIGTAVPSPDQLLKVKHHLLQHRSVEEYYNASMFENEALDVLESLFRKFDYAFVCGGSGLYIQALSAGIDDIPPVDQQIRKNLLRRLDLEGLESLRFELKKLDPDSWANIDLKNPARILKALEISLTTGKPYSSFLTRKSKHRDFSPLKIGLILDRDLLYARIERRVEEMMENGLLKEVQSCLDYRDMNALKTVGYKELFDYLDGQTSLDRAIQLIKRNSRRYARRQLTWFNRDKEITWFSPDRFEEILDHIQLYAQAGN